MLVEDEEKKMVDVIAKKLNVQLPNYVQDIYKVRRGKYNKVRIWSFFDFGTCRLTDLFLTDVNYNLIDITCDEYIGEDKSANREMVQNLLLEKQIEGITPITNYHGEDAHEIDEEIEEIFTPKEVDWSDLI